MSNEPECRNAPHVVSLTLAALVLCVLVGVSFWADAGEGGGFLALMLAISAVCAVVTAIASELWISLRQTGREARELSRQLREDHSSS